MFSKERYLPGEACGVRSVDVKGSEVMCEKGLK